MLIRMAKEEADLPASSDVLDYPESMSMYEREKPCSGGPIGRREENKKTTQACR
jgi:hypothetical protein